MRKIFTLFALLFFTVGITSAQVLTENFDYTAGQALTANGWTAHSSGGTNTILVTSPGLTYAGHPGSGVGNAATLATSGEDINKGFTSINSGSVYLSFLVNLSAVQSGDYFIGLYQTSSIFPLRLYAKTDGAGGYFLGVSKGSGTVSYDVTSRALGTTYFVVVNYTFNTGTTTDDVVNLWINPALGGTEPTPTVAAVSAGSDGSSISAVYLRQGAAANSATPQVDAILVGTTWAQVAPGASASPTLSSSSLTAFNNVCVNTTAGPNSFTISGSNLTTADVSVAALAGFTYSTTSGGTYSSTLTIPQTGGTFSQQVFVKFSPTAVQSYNGNIVVSGGGAASSVNVAAVGGGVNAPPTVTTGTTTGITTVAATAAGTITDPGCTSITEYGIEYSTTNGFANGSGTKVPASNLSSGAFSSNLSGLTPGITYYYKAYATNGAGTAYGAQDVFTTTPTGPSLTAGTVADFGNVIINTQSTSQSFTLSGSNLTGSTGSVTVSAPSTDFEVSNDNTAWGATTLVAYSSGTISNATVYVRFTPQSLGAKSGNITISGGGANTTVAVSGTGIPVPSPLLLTEPFNYTPDGTNDLEVQSGGVWTGINTGDAVLVTAGNLNYSGLAASTGNKIAFDGLGKDYYTPFTSQTSGSVYSSFILNVPSLGALDATGGYIAGFTPDNSTTTFGATVWTRASTTAGKYNIGIATRTTTADVSWIATDLDPGTSYFVVIAYDITTGTANDVSRMWLNPVPGNPEPAAGVTAVAGADLNNVGRFFIRQDSNNETPFVEMDELRVGTTWAAVTPAGAATPAITISSPLTAFGNVCVNTTAGPNSFTISGSNLTNADVTVAALAGFTYSTTAGGTYTSTLTLPQSGGTFSQQVFVKFAPTAVQSYTGNIVVNGGGISAAVNVAASGAGINTKPALTTGSASAITTATATAAGTITDAGCSSITEYGIEYSTTNGFADGAGTKVPATNLSSGAFSSNLSGLSAGITYYYKAYATNGGGTGYGAQQSFTTTAPTPVITTDALTAFGNVCLNTTAGPNSFTITGSNLTNADVTVAALAGFTYSTTAGGTYTSTLTLPQSGGAFSQQVFVKFTPTAVQSYSGNIVVNGGGISAAVNVAAAGAGINTKPALTTGSASAITTATATAAGTITDAGCSSITEYGIEYSTTNGFADGAGTKVPATNLSSGAFSSNLSGLSAGITYYYKAYATNGGGTGYGTQQSFTTTALTPTITTTALTAFGNVCVNTTAGPNSFTITGSNLTNADVTVAALAGFTYSTTAGGTYTSTLTLPQSGGAFSQQVFVKFAPTAVQSYNGNIVVNGGGISAAVNVAASGAGINTKPTVTTGASSAVTTVTATAAGTITDAGCSSITEYGIEYSTTNGFADGAGTKVPATNLSSGAFSSNLSGLTPGLAYYYKAYATNGGGTGYGAQQTFTTQSPSPSLTAGTVADFGNVAVGSQSVSQSFNLSGANLTGAPGSITVTAPSTDFEVSSNNSTWGPTATVAFTSATLASTPVYVRFTPQTSGLKTGNVSISGGSATTTVAVSGTGTTASASSLLVEPFNYTPDAASGLQAQSNGVWVGINSGDSVLVTSGNLNYTGLVASTGNKIAFDGSGRDYYASFTPQSSGSVYSSFVLNLSSLGSLGTTGGYFTGFIQDASTSAFGCAVWTRASTTAGKYNIGISTRSNSAVSWLAADLDPGTSYFVVRAYDFMSGTGDDVARIWLNPVPGNPEPAAGATAIAGADMTNIGRAFVRQDNPTNTPFVEMDELRVGTTWASVTPGAVITPTLTVSSPLTAFGNVCVNTTAGPNSFTISGTNLTNADISVAALAGFTYSTTSGGTYTSTLTLPQSGGTFSQQVFVKFTPTAVQSYNGNIVVSGGGASASVNAAASGAGVNTAPAVTTGAASGVTSATATLAGSITDAGCTSLTEYGIEYSTTNGFANGSGIKVTSSNLASGSFTSALSGLSAGITYYYKAYATNGGGTTYGTQQQFTTATLAPTLAATALTGFGNVCTGTTAGPNSFTISGSNLTNTDVTVAALAGFTYSTTSGGTYTSTLTLPQSGGTFSQQVFVKFSPVAVQSYNGNIVVAGGGAAASVNVAATGSGVNTPPSVTTGGSSAVTTSTATLAGTITATGCTAVTAYGIEYSTTNGFANGSGTQVASSNLASGAFSSGLSGLAASTTYYYKAYATNGGGTTYGSQLSFTTTAPPPPTITTTALTAFGNVCVNATAGPNSFTISGSNLTNANVTVGALAGFTYATTANGTYSATLNLTQSGGTYSQQVFVKFTPTAVQNYSGNIPVSGGGVASTVNVAVTGAGVSTAPTVITGAATNIFTSYATLGGQVTDAGCTAITQYGIEYSGINGFANGNGTKVYANNLASGQFSALVNGLVQGGVYYFKAFVTNAGGTSYGAQQTFTVASIPAGFTVYPVPAIRGSQFNFSMSGLTPGYYGLLFYGADGRLAYQYNMNIQVGFINQGFTLPATLAAGIYRVQLVSSTGTVATHSILVQ